jgi:hypothetical protein
VIAGDQVVGPYRLLITSSPEPAQTGAVTYVVRASDPTTGEKLVGLAITIRLVHSESGAVVEGAVTHEDAGSETEYAAHLALDEPGAWEGIISVQGPAGALQVPFLQRVAPPRRGLTLIVAGLPFLAALAVLLGIWFARRGRADPRAAPREDGLDPHA